MSSDDWTTATGLRRASLSLLWRAVVTAGLWCGALWGFHALLGGIGVTRVPMLIVVGFAVLLGTIAGFVMSRGLDETAGFVGPLLTLLAVVFAAIAVIGGEALFARFIPAATSYLRFMLVGTTMIVACVWIVKHTLLDG